MYQKSGSSWLKHIDFIILDILVMEFAFVFSCFIRDGERVQLSDMKYRNMMILLILVYTVVIFFNESYSGILRRGYYIEFRETVKHVTYVMLILLVYMFFSKQSEIYSRIVFLCMWILNSIFSYMIRIVWKRYMGKKRKNDAHRVLLLVASSDTASGVVKTIQKYNYEDFSLKAISIIDKDMTGKYIEEIPVVANIGSLITYIQKNWIDEVFFNTSRKTIIPQELIRCCMEMGVTIHMKLEKLDVLGNNQIVEKLAGYTVISRCMRVAAPKELFLKRFMDILGGLLGLAATGVITLFLAPMIKIKSPGPVFFSQTRIGKNGKRFTIYKFRSMYTDAEKRKQELMQENRIQDGFMFKLDHDPRIIQGIGDFIRKTSLDEFPQFWNVVKGDMSLVGTRPPTVDEWEKYEMHHRKRLAVKPGITGLWQVSGRSKIVDFEKVVALDTEYITNWSLLLDFRILCKTVQVVLKGEGSM